MRVKGKKSVLFFTALCCIAFAAYFVLSRQAVDHTAPEISFLNEEIEVSVGVTEAELLSGVTARDSRDGDVTGSLVVEGISELAQDHTATVTYAAFDKAGNVAKARRTLRYTDYESPRFSLSTPLVFRGGTSFNVLNYVGAVDVIDGTLDDRVKATLVSRDSSITAEGVHQVEFRVTNSMNDTVYLTVPVEVYSSAAYNATVELSENLVYLEKGARFDPNSYLKTLRVSGDLIDLKSYSDKVSVTTSSDVSTGTPGTYSVAYTVKYGGYTGYTRLIVVVEE